MMLWALDWVVFCRHCCSSVRVSQLLTLGCKWETCSTLMNTSMTITLTGSRVGSDLHHRTGIKARLNRRLIQSHQNVNLISDSFYAKCFFFLSVNSWILVKNLMFCGAWISWIKIRCNFTLRGRISGLLWGELCLGFWEEALWGERCHIAHAISQSLRFILAKAINATQTHLSSAPTSFLFLLISTEFQSHRGQGTSANQVLMSATGTDTRRSGCWNQIYLDSEGM